MEVEDLSPLAQRFPLTPTKGAPDEDDGFVDILESDLKVSSLAPSGPPTSPSLRSPKEESSELLQQDYDLISMSEEELEVTESQPDLWPIREQLAGAAVRGGWAGRREGAPARLLLALCKPGQRGVPAIS